MLIILPIFTLIILSLVFFKKGFSRRESILNAVVIWGLLITISTEFLSAVWLITFNYIAVFWFTVNLILGVLFLISKKRNCNEDNNERLLLLSKISIISIIIFSLCILALAILIPPNAFDVLTYHLARIMHWIQNQSVSHYKTNIIRQLYNPPWSEYVLMHFQILCGNDYFANTVQWLSMIFSIIGVSLVTKRLGGNINVQVFSALVCMTIPMGIIQGSVSKNDYVASMWLICFIFYALSFIKSSDDNNSSGDGNLLFNIFFAGASLGLALLTKVTAYVVVFPFLISFVVLMILKLKAKSLKFIFILGMIALSINLNLYIRNMALMGVFLVPPFEKALNSNSSMNIRLFLSNVIKILSLHLVTPIPAINNQIEHFIFWFHKLINVAVNDPNITLKPCGDCQAIYVLNKFNIRLGDTGNFIHTILFLCSLAAFVFFKKIRESKELIIYALCIIAGFSLFCYSIKYVSVLSGHQLPFFVLSVPFISIVFFEILNPIGLYLLTFLLIIAGIPYIIWNENKPLNAISLSGQDRLKNYFIEYPDYYQPYKNLTDQLNFVKCTKIVLIVGPNFPEYFLWASLKENDNQEIQIDYIIKDIYKPFFKYFPNNDFKPECMIKEDFPGEPALFMNTYQRSNKAKDKSIPH